MSKADKMFEELRYVTTLSNESFIYYHCVTNNITFNLIDKEVITSNISIKEHLAIHEKMKELGWYNE